MYFVDHKLYKLQLYCRHNVLSELSVQSALRTQ
jgi:hypothetical protein